jgi:trans-aconitate 2-methyltransferase
MSWDPSQYLRFAAPRLRPAVDLLARLAIDAPAQVVDLGCGTGNVTKLLRTRWPQARIAGVDDSAEMLANALGASNDVEWIRADLATWSPSAAPDVLYSNAALHWIADHHELFPRLFAAVAPKGVLAAQMPRNFDAPSHTAIADTVRGGPWRRELEPLLRDAPVGRPDLYYDLLAREAASLDIWETEYLQVLEGADPVKEWTKGTWLKQFLDALAPGERTAFEADYAARVARAYPRRADGTTLFPFRRLFIVAQRRA